MSVVLFSIWFFVFRAFKLYVYYLHNNSFVILLFVLHETTIYCILIHYPNNSEKQETIAKNAYKAASNYIVLTLFVV